MLWTSFTPTQFPVYSQYGCWLLYLIVFLINQFICAFIPVQTKSVVALDWLSSVFHRDFNPCECSSVLSSNAASLAPLLSFGICCYIHFTIPFTLLLFLSLQSRPWPPSPPISLAIDNFPKSNPPSSFSPIAVIADTSFCSYFLRPTDSERDSSSSCVDVSQIPKHNAKVDVTVQYRQSVFPNPYSPHRLLRRRYEPSGAE